MAEPTQRSVASRFLLVTLALPAALAAAAVALTLSWRGDLPDPIAVHWGANGAPDGYGSLTMSVVLMAALAFGIPAAFAVFAARFLARGGRGVMLRLMGAMALGMSALYVVLITWTIGMQRGVGDAADGPTIGWAFLAALVAGVAAGFAGYYLQPAQRAPEPPAVEVDAIALGDTEQVAWIRPARSAAWLRGLLIAVVALLAIGTALVAALDDRSTVWIMLAATVLIVVMFAMLTAFTVRVDEAGLAVRSRIGFPTLRVPLADVKSASVTSIEGFSEFGGYGLRWTPAGTGVILANGEALRVERANGKAFVVTVDDAATGAAVLTALAKRRDAKAS